MLMLMTLRCQSPGFVAVVVDVVAYYGSSGADGGSADVVEAA